MHSMNTDARWTVAHYAAMQPRGNATWQMIVEDMIQAFEKFLVYAAGERKEK
jgi:hypothetical protein